jgi:hypothetical protein
MYTLYKITGTEKIIPNRYIPGKIASDADIGEKRLWSIFFSTIFFFIRCSVCVCVCVFIIVTAKLTFRINGGWQNYSCAVDILRLIHTRLMEQNTITRRTHVNRSDVDEVVLCVCVWKKVVGGVVHTRNLQIRDLFFFLFPFFFFFLINYFTLTKHHWIIIEKHHE